jgi:glycosyltransferase involved in cell wall biosynthesis
VVAALHNRRAVARFLADGPVDAVLAMSLRRLGLEPVRALERRGVPVVLTVNDDWPVAFAQRRRLVDRLPPALHTFRGVATRRVIYLSEAIRRAVLDAGAPLPEGQVCAQGVDLKVFSPRAFRPLAMPLSLLYVGRVHPSKGTLVAVAALAALKRRGIEAQLTIAGPVDDPAYGAEVKALAEREGVSGRIRWLGLVARADLPRLYAEAHALVYLATWEKEGQGLVYLEAMACGVPVVCFVRGGAEELLDAHPAAERVMAPDGEQFAEAIARLMGDEARQRTLIDAGLRLVREHASLDGYVTALETALRESAQARQ